MGLSPQVLLKGLVSRFLPIPIFDGPEGERATRLGPFGDNKVESVWPTEHLLCDEGTLMVASILPGATPLQLGLSAAFSATAAAFVLTNTDNPNVPGGGKRLFPRRLRLAQSVAPTSGVDLRYAIVLDSILRAPTTLSSGTGGSGPGTPATATAYRAPVVCTNAGANPGIVGVPYFPLSAAAGAPPTVPAASAFARTIVGNGYLKNSIPVVKDQYILQFGGPDSGGQFQAAAALAKIVENCPAVCISPGQSMLIYLWSASNATAGNAWDDVAMEWVER